jgi:AcrR family transcriptional regulator
MRLLLLPQVRVRSRAAEEKVRRQRDAILAAAARLLKLNGYDAMTLYKIAAEAGITKPTLYKHFSSKEELGVQILLHSIGDAHEHLLQLERQMPPAEALRAMIEWSIDRHFGTREAIDFTRALSLFDHPSVQNAERDFTATFAALVAKAQYDGSIQSSVPPMLVAQALHSILKDSAYKHARVRSALDLGMMKDGVVRLLLASRS